MLYDVNRYLWVHILLVFLTILAMLLIFLKKEWLKKNQKKFERYIIILSVLALIGRYASYILWRRYTAFLPLFLCNLSVFLVLFYLLLNKTNIQKYVYLYSFFAIGAIAYPDLSFTYKDIIAYTFFFDHILLFVMPFYLILIHDYEPRFRDIIKPMIIVTILIVLSSRLNYIFDENYFYLATKPIFPFLDDKIYIIIMLGVLLFGFVLITFIGKIIYNKNK